MQEEQYGKNRKKILCFGIYVCIFLFLLILNILSLYITDDFRYLYSFHDDRRIAHLSQILMSMRAHRYKMNGRLVPHILVQMMGMLPMWAFDVVNAAMFVGQIMLIQKIAGGKDILQITAVFFAVWLFCPAFGQVNLWQDGACNYLWSVVFALLFLVPYAEDFLHEKRIKSWYAKAGFLILSFAMGAYSETVSAAAIGMATLLVIVMWIWQKRKPRGIWLWSIALAFVGYCSIYTAPAQWREKAVEMTVSNLFANFVGIAVYYWHSLGVLLVVFLTALVWNLWSKVDIKRTVLGCVFFAGSLAAGFILIFASYHSPRSLVGAFAFLLTADCILLCPLWEKRKSKKLIAAGFVALTIAVIPPLIYGTQDIWNTYQSMKANEAYIYECKAQGISEVRIPLVMTKTQYSEANGLVYLDTEDPTTWPNDFMAVYYDVNSLLGYYP